MALRGNRPDFFAGVGGGFPADAKVFPFFGVVVTGQGSRRKLPDFFAGGWPVGGVSSRRMRGLFTPAAFCGGTGSGTLRLCGVVVTGQGSRRKLPGFFAGLVTGGGFPADEKVFSFCGAVITGQGSRRKLPDFFAGLAGGGAKLLQGAGLRRKGADDCGFYARRRGWGFCGGGGRGIFTILLQKRRLRCFSGAAAL